MNYYTHTVRVTNFSFSDLDKINDILACGCILSRRRQQELRGDKDDFSISEASALFNGMDYISLCDLLMVHNDYSAYNMYVKQGLSLLFDHRIPVIVPKIIKTQANSLFFSDEIHKLGMGEERFSDLSDEVQVRDMVSLQYFRGLMLPVNRFYEFHSETILIEYISSLYELLLMYHYPVPIINLDTEKEIIVERGKIKSL